MKKYTLNDCPVHVQIPVAWGDMDAFGHVNNIQYFRYFETARIEYFNKLMPFTGGPMSPGPILAETSCKFKAPVVFPDTLTVGAKVVSIEDDRFEMVFVAQSESLDRVAAAGSSTIVSFDYETQQKVPVPDTWISTIRTLEQWSS